ncbi:FAD-dependent oxidoreductase [Actinomycetospora corticicola]|uniref:2-polyprenyl-6-methoxyphenol hydroxylase-like FAD-dependent oxidoreductase n=1 Tax=Actinomycetospora corticicola TaxID=663602 RepID=A0A7Y9E0I2_9PSEU|nr:FAD-dependent oxidoreductase [Actinomycetospora corticicola]NYD38974.1 2-polyprenyl-6-methoxyphenol hydroxylase-like FAD-dependent oxidoreductase [Actinomycetospora corticicola]
MERTTCCVVGGGPAGMVLGLLLARAGVEVTVLEKHGDFLRDFRGDTVHTSTLTLLDELGLWPRFDALPYRALTRVRLRLDEGEVTIGDMSRLDAPHPMVAMTPQWHLLDMLATAAREEPTFTLRMHTEVAGLVRTGGRVTGVRLGDGSVLEADLVVACDGRDSRVRAESGLPLHRYDVPIDVEWFRVPRHPDDPDGGLGRVRRGRFLVMLDRGDYFQCALVVSKGDDARLRAGSVQVLRDVLTGMNPWMTGRLDAMTWDDVKLLEVSLDRLTRWSAPGVLCIGDAAHAMSPIGGVGINLAVQDAVAAARLLAHPLLAHDPEAVDRAGRAVQRRRTPPTVVTQTAQDLAHRRVVAPVLDAGPGDGEDAVPLPFRLAQRFPVLQWVPARAVGIGVLPEHAPDFARRPPLPLVAPAS